MPEVLRFGITSLDELFGVPSETSRHGLPAGIYLPPVADGDADTATPTTSVCIAGPTGTGKSIFALHMASTYLADCRIEQARMPKSLQQLSLPTVLYVSTDLTHNMAQRAWANFSLDLPTYRREPFVASPRRLKDDRLEILLKDCHPTSLAEKFDMTETENSNVIFLDMAGHTAGDDWGFLHKILSLLPQPKAGAPRHLVVIDAIEGFEALAGKLDAFGEKSTRRSRIAQVMRLISGKCHVVLVVEQGESSANGATLDEEFVADTVIRLDSITTRNYERRVLKVEKCRGQSHIRGQHHYSIRSGKGSTTGDQMNPDDPRLNAVTAQSETEQTSADVKKIIDSDRPQVAGSKARDEVGEVRTQSYVQVFHSVHRISRKIMEADTLKRANLESGSAGRYAAFGIKYLDNMLGGKTEFTERVLRKGHAFAHDTRGLPCGSTTALIGDSLTQKSRLGKAFLSRCFTTLGTRLSELHHDLTMAPQDDIIAESIWQRIVTQVNVTSTFSSPEVETSCRDLLDQGHFLELARLLNSVVKNDLILSKVAYEYAQKPSYLLFNLAAWMLDYEGGVAVMLATHNTDVDSLANEFLGWFPSAHTLTYLPYRDAVKNYIKRGTVCRRLEIHSLSSEVLIHIVRECIREAQKKILTPSDLNEPNRRLRNSWPVRVVIDDFSSLRHIFPELREDPLLFPSILFHLEREGVTTLIIDTQSGKPEATVVERFETELRQMVDHRLYTWRVPFYGESRVAITAIPPLSREYAGIVRELRWETEGEAPRGEPAIVDPHFELYSGLEEFKPKPVPLQMRLFVDTPAMQQYIDVQNTFLGEIFDCHSNGENANVRPIIVGVPPADYGDLRSFAYLQRDTRLDHSYVFAVDEFWLMRPPGRHKRAGAFQPQWSYLDAVTASSNREPTKAEDYKANHYADPYELFQLRNEDIFPLKHGKRSPELRRRHFYEKYYEDFKDYETFDKENEKEDYHLDRVPYSWDFGFLLCQKSAWANNNRLLNVARWDGQQQMITVKEIWQLLIKAEYGRSSTTTSTHADAKDRPYVSWRIFAEACKKAAEEQSSISSKRVTAFDFAQVSPESLSCLILEMWLSQIHDSLTLRADQLRANGQESKEAEQLEKERDELVAAVQKRKLFIPVGERAQKAAETHILLDLLKKYWKELYITWLLLIEIIDLPTVIGDATVSTFDFKSKNTDFCAVASRHWYKTATQCPDEIAAREPLVAVRLPGRFAVRGDWFLAISGGSRSIRQAERAVDLLSSRRANVTRLQMGVGLPTRVPRPDGHGALFTKLISHERGKDSLEYEVFLKIAANDDGKFFWLWRSSLDGYAQCNRIWHRWLNRTLLWWHRTLLRYRSAWVNSFAVCDALLTSTKPFAPTREELSKHHVEVKDLKAADAKDKRRREFLEKYVEAKAIAQLRIRVEFNELLTGLKSELQQVSIKLGE